MTTYPRTIGDWPGMFVAMVVRSLRSKMCLSPSRLANGGQIDVTRNSDDSRER